MLNLAHEKGNISERMIIHLNFSQSHSCILTLSVSKEKLKFQAVSETLQGGHMLKRSNKTAQDHRDTNESPMLRTQAEKVR